MKLFVYLKFLTNLFGHRHDSVTSIRQTRLNSAAISRTWQEFDLQLLIEDMLRKSSRISYESVASMMITCANNKHL